MMSERNLTYPLLHLTSALPPALNTVRLLCSFGTPEQARSIPVHAGASSPLVRHLASGSGIHGVTGLDGVEGLLDISDPLVAEKQALALQGNAVTGMADAMRELPEGEQLVIIATGSLTNVALVVSVFPELVRKKCSEIVLMGGAEGELRHT